jgi:hypothetical protein
MVGLAINDGHTTWLRNTQHKGGLVTEAAVKILPTIYCFALVYCQSLPLLRSRGMTGEYIFFSVSFRMCLNPLCIIAIFVIHEGREKRDITKLFRVRKESAKVSKDVLTKCPFKGYWASSRCNGSHLPAGWLVIRFTSPGRMSC